MEQNDPKCSKEGDGRIPDGRSTTARSKQQVAVRVVRPPTRDVGRFTINLDRLIVLSKSRLLGWFLHVSLILIIKGRYPREVSLIVIIKQVSS